MGRLFGTDGVRGVANKDLTPELAFVLGQAGATVLAQQEKRPTILIGKDTRISGDMLEAALVAGITSVGADVVLLGVIPTPGVAYLTRELEADAGIMISASHNPVADNGIKFFAHTGFKLPDEVEDEIEALINSKAIARPIGVDVGRVIHKADAVKLYIDHVLSTVKLDLSGMHIALDCANGAASHVTPAVLTALGAKVSVIHHEPNGLNINEQCGSTYPEEIKNYVKQVGADVGITHDGDADRVLAVDEQGNLVDGDHILAICGLHMLEEGCLQNKKIAATVYSNGGLTQAMHRAGGDLVITPNGDRYVLEAMLAEGLSLGGEKSGHVIFLDYNTTGDGVITALQLLTVLVKKQKPLSQLAQVMLEFPQILENIRVRSKDGWDENLRIQAAIKDAEMQLGEEGRVFVRASGTESLIRVMGEHPDHELLERALQPVVAAVKTEQGL